MPTTRRNRTIAAPADELWEVVSDPHHLPRWWPRVTRVEAVDADAFTEVLQTASGKLVRADFTLVADDREQRRLTWSQQLEGSPFARLLSAAETEVRLTAAGAATDVELELRQSLPGLIPSSGRGTGHGGWFTGFSPRLGAYLLRRAAAATLEEALDGLERISAVAPPLGSG